MATTKLSQAACQCAICQDNGKYPKWLQTKTTWGDVLVRLMAVGIALGALYLLLLLAWTFPLFGVVAAFILLTSILLELAR